MRVAILFAGQPRFRKSLDDLVKNIIGYSQLDWYFYLWNSSYYRLHYAPIPLVPPKWADIESREWAVENIKNKLSWPPHILAGIDYSEIVYKDPLQSQYSSLYRADRMRQECEKIHGKYDLVIRARLDDCISHVNLTDIKLHLEQESNVIYTPLKNKHYIHGHGMCDHFAISSSENMKIYTDLILHMTNYLEQGFPSHHEGLLSYHLGLNNIKLIETLDYEQYPETWDNIWE